MAQSAQPPKAASPSTEAFPAPGGDVLDTRWFGATIQREHWHFHRQLLNRYGVILAPGEFSWIVSMLETGKALLVQTRGPKQAIYSIRLPRVQERIYVLATGCRLVTAWPPTRRLNATRRNLANQSVGA